MSISKHKNTIFGHIKKAALHISEGNIQAFPANMIIQAVGMLHTIPTCVYDVTQSDTKRKFDSEHSCAVSIMKKPGAISLSVK